MAKKRASGIEPPKKQSRRLGYVDGKMQIIEAPIYDGVLDEVTVTPNTKAIYNMMENPFGGTASTYEPSDLTTYLLNKAANPFTTAGFLARGQKVPDRVESKGNVFDMAADIVNPAAWVDYADKGFEDLKKGDLPGAGLNFLGATPALPATKSALFPTVLKAKVDDAVMGFPNKLSQQLLKNSKEYKNISEIKQINKELRTLMNKYEEAAAKSKSGRKSADRFMDAQSEAYRQANMMDDIYNVKAPDISVQDIMAGPSMIDPKKITQEFVDDGIRTGVFRENTTIETAKKILNISEDLEHIDNVLGKQISKFQSAEDELIAKIYKETGEISARPQGGYMDDLAVDESGKLIDRGYKEALTSENPIPTSTFARDGEFANLEKQFTDHNNVINEYIRQNPNDKTVKNFISELEKYRLLATKGNRLTNEYFLEDLKAYAKNDANFPYVGDDIDAFSKQDNARIDRLRQTIDDLTVDEYQMLADRYAPYKDADGGFLTGTSERYSGSPTELMQNDLQIFENDLTENGLLTPTIKKLFDHEDFPKFLSGTLEGSNDYNRAHIFPKARYVETYTPNVDLVTGNSPANLPAINSSRANEFDRVIRDMSARFTPKSENVRGIINKRDFSPTKGQFYPSDGSAGFVGATQFDDVYKEAMMKRLPIKSEFQIDYSNPVLGLPTRRLNVLDPSDNLVWSRAEAMARSGEKKFKPLADKILGEEFINSYRGVGDNDKGLYSYLAKKYPNITSIPIQDAPFPEPRIRTMQRLLKQESDKNYSKLLEKQNRIDDFMGSAVPFYRNYSQPLVMPIRTYSNNRNK